MACFLISTAEAIVVTALKKHTEAKEARENLETTVISSEAAGTHGMTEETDLSVSHRIPFSRKLKWLSGLLWGGAALLAFEHIWHGEVVAWFPFLSAMSNSADTAEMLHEMATVGVGMAALITAVWGAMCVAADAIVKRTPEMEAEAETVHTDAR